LDTPYIRRDAKTKAHRKAPKQANRRTHTMYSIA